MRACYGGSSYILVITAICSESLLGTLLFASFWHPWRFERALFNNSLPPQRCESFRTAVSSYFYFYFFFFVFIFLSFLFCDLEEDLKFRMEEEVIQKCTDKAPPLFDVELMKYYSKKI